MDNTPLTTELKAHFLRLYQMAFTDDNFDVLELQVLYHLAEERGVPKEELDKLLLNPVSHETSVPGDLATKVEYLYDLVRLMWADGKVTEDEMVTLRKYCRKFEFLDQNIDDLCRYLVDCVGQGVKKQDIINQLNT